MKHTISLQTRAEVEVTTRLTVINQHHSDQVLWFCHKEVLRNGLVLESGHAYFTPRALAGASELYIELAISDRRERILTRRQCRKQVQSIKKLDSSL